MSGKIAGKNATRRPSKITKKQAAAVKVKMANPDATLLETGRKAGYKGNDKEVAASAYRALSSAAVRERFQAAMERCKDLSDETLLQKLVEGLDAKVTKLFAHEGHIVDSEEMVDFSTRGMYLNIASKWKGLEVSRNEVTGAGGSALIPDASPAVAELSKEQLLSLIASMDAVVNPVLPVAKQE